MATKQKYKQTKIFKGMKNDHILGQITSDFDKNVVLTTNTSSQKTGKDQTINKNEFI